MREEFGNEMYYYSKLWDYWFAKCVNEEITEEQMEDKLDRYENMSVAQRKRECKRLGIMVM